MDHKQVEQEGPRRGSRDYEVPARAGTRSDRRWRTPPDAALRCSNEVEEARLKRPSQKKMLMSVPRGPSQPPSRRTPYTPPRFVRALYEKTTHGGKEEDEGRKEEKERRKRAWEVRW